MLLLSTIISKSKLVLCNLQQPSHLNQALLRWPTCLFKEIKWHLLMMQLIKLGAPVKFLQRQAVSSILTAPIIKARTYGISFVFTAQRLCPHILTHRLHLMNLFITASLYWHLVDWRGVGCDAVWMQSNICTWWMAKSVLTMSWRMGRTLELEPQHSRWTGKKAPLCKFRKENMQRHKGKNQWVSQNTT